MTTKLTPLGGGGGSSIINNYYSEVVDSTGFVDPAASTLSFDDGTRTFTITPVGDSFVFYAFGVRYEKTSAESKVIPDVDGLWYIYYDADGDLDAADEIWDLSSQVPVATVLWDSGSGDVGDDTGGGKPSKFEYVYIMGVSVAGILEDGQTVLLHAISASETVELRKHLPFSVIKCGTAPTGNVSFDIKVNGVSKGSADIDAAATQGTFTWNNKVTLDPEDLVKITAPGTADATLEDVAISLVGIRV